MYINQQSEDIYTLLQISTETHLNSTVRVLCQTASYMQSGQQCQTKLNLPTYGPVST